MTRPQTPKDIIGNIHQHEKEIVMKAENEETSWLLEEVGKGSVQVSVQVSMKGIKDQSSAHKPVIKYGKGERWCLLDGGNGMVPLKQEGDS